jgi:hypothetical protein
MGGVFNLVNLHVYHYAGNNPVKYTDPDGREIEVEGNLFYKIHVFFALGKIERALKKSGDKEALADFRDLKNSKEYKLTIHRDKLLTVMSKMTLLIAGEYMSNQFFDNENNKSNPEIHYEPKNKSGGEDASGQKERPSFIGLAHEFKHAIDHFRKIDALDSPANDSVNFPNKSEERAVGFENIIRGVYWKNNPARQRNKY